MKYEYYTWYYTPAFPGSFAHFVYYTPLRCDEYFSGFEIIGDNELDFHYSMRWEAVNSLGYLKNEGFLLVKGSALDKLHNFMLDLSKEVIRDIFTVKV